MGVQPVLAVITGTPSPLCRYLKHRLPLLSQNTEWYAETAPPSPPAATVKPIALLSHPTPMHRSHRFKLTAEATVGLSMKPEFCFGARFEP